MDELVASLRVLTANAMVLYFKGHSYHWNVEGIEFPSLHKFFGDFYENIYDSVDPLSENLRKLDRYAPISLHEILSQATIDEDTVKPSTINSMLANLYSANEEILESLNTTFKHAEKENSQGLVNFLASRIEQHELYKWQIRAMLKQG